MKAIILSAGMGKRMWPLTRNTPKCLLEIESGVSVLESQLEAIKKCPQITKVVLVLGYLVEQVEAKIKHYQTDLNIEIVYNPFFGGANNFISLWTAMHEMNEDFIIINGDNIFKTDLLQKMIDDARQGIIVSVSKKDKYVEEDMKVLFEGENVKYISKKIPVEQAQGESIGIIKVSGEEARRRVVNSKKDLLRNPQSKDIFWLEIFNHLVKQNYPLQFMEFDDKDWAEIDFHVDRDSLTDSIKKPIRDILE